jgi:hypothetical protein
VSQSLKDKPFAQRQSTHVGYSHPIYIQGVSLMRPTVFS